jgi:hypothetical protein
MVNSLSIGENDVSDRDMEKINSMVRNGPVKELDKSKIYVRRMIILGEEPTTKMSVHFKETLSEINDKIIGVPMMEGHEMNKVPWGRVFDSEMVDGVEGYSGSVIKIAYYFLRMGSGEERAEKIDAGIENEGSITYRFKSAHCTICGQRLMIGSFLGMTFTSIKCTHKLGETYNGKKCYWYPKGVEPVEVSHVFSGAYPKTKAVMNSENVPKNSEEMVVAYGGCGPGEVEIGLTDAIIAEMSGNSGIPSSGEWEKLRKLFQRPIKPVKTEKNNNEYYDIDAFKEFTGDYDVEPKYNGVFARLEKYKGKAMLFTEENNDISGKFGIFISEANELDADNFITHCEIVKYKGRVRGTFADVMAYINSKGGGNDEPFRLKPFMVCVMDGKSLHGHAINDCRNAMKSIKYGKKIHPVKYKSVSGGDDIVKTIKMMATREGAMVKSHEMTADENGRNKIFKWKKQVDIDARVIGIEKKQGGTFIYECEIGNGSDRKKIGKTYVTSVVAAEGDIIYVSADYVTYDEKEDRYTWYAPKVVEVRKEKKEAEPISSVKRMAEKKENKPSSKIKYDDVVRMLLSSEIKTELYICGGLAEKMESESDIDILTKVGLDEAAKDEIRGVFGDYGCRVDFIVNENGPDGNYYHYVAGKDVKKRFVLQRHSYGRSVHYDIRFTTKDGKRMWGFTCFKKPSMIAGGKKVLCDEKEYHDLKWMEVDGEIKPGNPGNPTKSQIASMIIIDKGEYEYIKSKSDFIEIILHGKDYKGRYVFRKVEAERKKEDDEVGSRGKIWLFWKTLNQEVNGKVENISLLQKNDKLIFWSS